MARARWIGCTQNGGPILDFGANVKFQYDFFQWTIYVGLCENMNGSMLYYARFDYAIFIESAWLLDPKAYLYGKIGPRYYLTVILKFNALDLKGNWPGL
jgi:hypothetical protein